MSAQFCTQWDYTNETHGEKTYFYCSHPMQFPTKEKKIGNLSFMYTEQLNVKIMFKKV